MSKSNFKLVSGAPTTYEAKGGSGNPTFRKFCGTCSCVMWNESPKFPDIVIVKAGVIDDGGFEKITPGSESFTSRKPTWVGQVEGAKQFHEAFQA